MTTYTALSDTSLAQDKPLTQSIARALRDNPLAIREGDTSAPKVEVLAINNGALYATTSSAAPTIGSNGTIPFSEEVTDSNGWFNNTTYRYTPQKAGLYLFTCKVGQGTGGTASDGHARLIKNASVMAGTKIEAANVLMTPISIILPMNGSTDYIYVDVNYSSGSFTIGGSSSNFFSAVLVAST